MGGAEMTNKSGIAVPKRGSAIPVAAPVFSGAMVEMPRWWLERDAPQTPAWMDERFHDIVWGGLGGGMSKA
jgi:hypothetical protein